MSETNDLPLPAWSPRLRLSVFLGLVLLVRLVHLSLLGTSLTGMNPKMAVLAKDWMRHGLGAASIDVAPGPILLLASLAGFAGLPPADLIPVMLLVAHVVLATGFWYWLRSLHMSRDLEVTSLVLFLFVPGNNSYVGFDNYPVLFATAAFFAATSIWHQKVAGPGTARSWIYLFLLGVLIAMFRGEYLVFLPLYLLVFYLGHRFFHGSFPPSHALLAGCVMLLGLGIGIYGVMWFHHLESGQFSLVPRDYTCWAFLDGTPPAWQSPGDDSEAARVQSGIAHFGHPAEYDYSAFRMMRENPRATLSKFVLNLPSWLFQLGRRHVVMPVPLAALALLGAVTVIGRRTTNNAVTNWPALFAAIVMTIPLAGLIVSARYMLPAFAAMCTLAAVGLLVVFQWVHHGKPDVWPRQRIWWVGMTLICVGLELLLLRGGGLLRDASDLQPIAHYAQEQLGGPQRQPIVLDPYDHRIHGACRANICNRRIQRALGLSMYGFDRRDAVTTATSEPARALALHTALMWTEGRGNSAVDRQRLAAWAEAGFHVSDRRTLEADAERPFTVWTLSAQIAPSAVRGSEQKRENTRP